MTSLRFALLCFLFLIPSQVAMALGYQDAYYGHQSNQFFKKQKFEKSQEYLQNIKNQNHPSVQNNLGNLYSQQEKYEEAEKAYLNAIQLSSGHAKAKALYNLGNSYYQNSKFEQALKAYKQALALQPKDKRIQKNMELTYRMMKIQQPQKAKKNTQKQDPKQDPNNSQGQPQQDPKNNQKPLQNNPQKNQDSPKPSNELKSVLDTLEQREKQVRAKYLNKPKKEKPVQYDW